jgi:hypothetical protein
VRRWLTLVADEILAVFGRTDFFDLLAHLAEYVASATSRQV